MMGKMQREKGAEGEREVIEIFRANNIECFRTQNIDGKQIRGDIYGIPGHFVEVRRRERLEVSRWMAEVADEAAGSKDSFPAPLLITRRSREPWMAVLWLPDFIDLLKEAKSL